MKHLALIVACTYFTSFSHSQKMAVKPFYKYQIGLENSLGGTFEKNIKYLYNVQFGLQVGSFFRVSNHQIGIRYSYFTRPNGIFTFDFTQTINVYYGFTFATKAISLSPQFGGGNYQSNDGIANNWRKYNLEYAIQIAFTGRGNGFYIRPFHNWSPQRSYIGITFGGIFGYAWNK